jgi:hypothetical protein
MSQEKNGFCRLWIPQGLLLSSDLSPAEIKFLPQKTLDKGFGKAYFEFKIQNLIILGHPLEPHLIGRR